MSFQSKFLQASGSARKIRDRLLAPQRDGSSNGAEDGSHGGLQGKLAGGGWGFVSYVPLVRTYKGILLACLRRQGSISP